MMSGKKLFNELPLNKSNVQCIGLVSHLKTHFPAMYHLYKVLKAHSTPPTDDELLIAAGKKVLNAKAASEFLQKLEKASNTIIKAFNQQNLKDAVCS
jgi:hypothetical protein